MDEFKQLLAVHSNVRVNGKFTMVAPLISLKARFITASDLQGLFKAAILTPTDIVVKSKWYKGMYTLMFLYFFIVFKHILGFRVENDGGVDLIYCNKWVRIGAHSFPPSDARFPVGVVYCQVLEVFSLAYKTTWDGPTVVKDVSFSFIFYLFLN